MKVSIIFCHLKTKIRVQSLQFKCDICDLLALGGNRIEIQNKITNITLNMKTVVEAADEEALENDCKIDQLRNML